MTPIRTLRDDFALAAFGAALAADLTVQNMLRAQGVVGVQGRPVPVMVNEAYMAADVALEIRANLPPQTLTAEQLASIRGAKIQ